MNIFIRTNLQELWSHEEFWAYNLPCESLDQEKHKQVFGVEFGDNLRKCESISRTGYQEHLSLSRYSLVLIKKKSISSKMKVITPDIVGH